MTIKQYECDVDYIGGGDYVAEMVEHDDGDYVAHEDHVAAIAAAEARGAAAERARIVAWLIECAMDSVASEIERGAHLEGGPND